ncbi:MAG: hypothetical protein KC897_10350, partial [Candidatus Omnitrophica bacterium]|nr:hypothetical protein [Candidatus Omnitrophota bacterium]
MRKSAKSGWYQHLHRAVTCVVAVLFIFAQIPTVSYAQFTGGPFSGDEESSLGDDIYTGGPNSGLSSGTSPSAESLSHGAPTKLVFTQYPSATKHSVEFRRQPIIEIRDANDNLVTTDNSTQVTLDIFNNPGAGELRGTTTLTASGGKVEFTGLSVTTAGEMY